MSQGKTTSVLTRRNFHVIGSEEAERFIRKVPGADRYNATVVGNLPVNTIFRYYATNNQRKNFFFSGGSLYFIDEAGNFTQNLGVFNQGAYPTFIEMQVASGHIAYFMEGIDTGMYSHDGNNSNAWQKETDVTLNFVDAVSWLDRLWGVEENSEDLFFSVNLIPTNFTDSTDAGVITIGARRGSKIQRIMVGNDDNLYIFKNDSTWVIEGKTPSEFQVREINPSMGLAARRSLQKVNNGMIGLMSDYEVYSFDGQNFKLLTYNVSLSGDHTKNLIPIMNLDRMDEIASIYHNFVYRMSFTESGKVFNNLEYCFDTINETEFFTQDFNIASYLVYDRPPDKKELIFGRSDTGRLMKMFHGLNVDNQATLPTMSFETKTMFMGLDEPRNFRARKVWLNSGVLGARTIPVRTYLDARQSITDYTSEEMTTYGEYKNPITAIRIATQDAITSRQIPRHGNSKGQNIAFEIKDNAPNIDFEFSSISVEIIQKAHKRGFRVGI